LNGDTEHQIYGFSFLVFFLSLVFRPIVQALALAVLLNDAPPGVDFSSLLRNMQMEPGSSSAGANSSSGRQYWNNNNSGGGGANEGAPPGSESAQRQMSNGSASPAVYNNNEEEGWR